MTEPALQLHAGTGGARWLTRRVQAASAPQHAVGGDARHAWHAGQHEHHPQLQHHFYSMDQQLEASTLGMWVFLVTEIMFFGGLFMAYIVYRYWYPDAWAAASNHLNVRMGGAQHARADLQLADDGAGGPRGADRIAQAARSST